LRATHGCVTMWFRRVHKREGTSACRRTICLDAALIRCRLHLPPAAQTRLGKTGWLARTFMWLEYSRHTTHYHPHTHYHGAAHTPLPARCTLQTPDAVGITHAVYTTTPHRHGATHCCTTARFRASITGTMGGFAGCLPRAHTRHAHTTMYYPTTHTHLPAFPHYPPSTWIGTCPSHHTPPYLPPPTHTCHTHTHTPHCAHLLPLPPQLPHTAACLAHIYTPHTHTTAHLLHYPHTARQDWFPHLSGHTPWWWLSGLHLVAWLLPVDKVHSALAPSAAFRRAQTVEPSTINQKN